MFGPFVGTVAVLPMLVILSIGIVLVAARRPVIRVGHTVHVRLVALHRHTSRWRWIGLGVGVLGAIGCTLLTGTALGRFVALAPAALAAGVLVGTIAGELTARGPQGPRREASLATRSVAGVLAGQRPWLAVGSAVLLVAALVTGTLLGSADDQGRAGRALLRSCVAPGRAGVEDQLVTERRTPWPGSFYTVPLGIAVLVLAVLAVLALRSIALRRGAGQVSEGLDLMTRRWAAGNVVMACSVSTLLIAGPLASVMAGTLAGVQCRTAGDIPLAWVLLVVGMLATGAGLAMLAGLFLGPRLVVDDLPGALPEPPAHAGVPVR